MYWSRGGRESEPLASSMPRATKGGEQRDDSMISFSRRGASSSGVTEHHRDRFRRALRDADWEALLPGLLAYAAARLRRVGWARGNDVEPSRMSVEQLVNSAVEACLDGTRSWDPTAVDLPGFLRGVIRSLTSSEKKKSVRAKTDTFHDFERIAPLADSPEDDALAEERRIAILSSIEACTTDDEDLRALYLAILDGAVKREEIAAVLGWPADRVTSARIKLQRRLLRRAPTTFAPVHKKQRRASA